jgi:hypothetical protein
MDENSHKAPQTKGQPSAHVRGSDLERLGRWLALLFAGVFLLAVVVCIALIAAVFLFPPPIGPPG